MCNGKKSRKKLKSYSCQKILTNGLKVKTWLKNESIHLFFHAMMKLNYSIFEKKLTIIYNQVKFLINTSDSTHIFLKKYFEKYDPELSRSLKICQKPYSTIIIPGLPMEE